MAFPGTATLASTGENILPSRCLRDSGRDAFVPAARRR
jgi:hypothetical protein